MNFSDCSICRLCQSIVCPFLQLPLYILIFICYDTYRAGTSARWIPLCNTICNFRGKRCRKLVCQLKRRTFQTTIAICITAGIYLQLVFQTIGPFCFIIYIILTVLLLNSLLNIPCLRCLIYNCQIPHLNRIDRTAGCRCSKLNIAKNPMIITFCSHV